MDDISPSINAAFGNGTNEVLLHQTTEIWSLFNIVNKSEEKRSPPLAPPGHLPPIDLPDPPNNFTPKAWKLNDEYPVQYAVPVYGYLFPPLTFIITITNSLICLVLLKKHMRSPTNILLAAIAVSDMLCVLCPLPAFCFFFTTGRVEEYIPFEWCVAVRCLCDTLPLILHTSSIWLTIVLAVQRYICVCHPLQARVWCTMGKTVRMVVVVFVLAVLSHVSTLAERETTAVEVPSAVVPNTTVVGCRETTREWVRWNNGLYYHIYYWHRVIIMQVIPCTSLSVLTFLLIRTMRRAVKTRAEMLSYNAQREVAQQRESASTTLMLVTVDCLYLVVEVPCGIFILFQFVSIQYDLDILEPSVILNVSVILNFIIVVSYPLNFVVYCTMSKKFRETFKRLCSPARNKTDTK